MPQRDRPTDQNDDQTTFAPYSDSLTSSLIVRFMDWDERDRVHPMSPGREETLRRYRRLTGINDNSTQSGDVAWRVRRCFSIVSISVGGDEPRSMELKQTEN